MVTLVSQEQPTLTRWTSLTHFRVGEWQHAPAWLRSLKSAASYTFYDLCQQRFPLRPRLQF